jgi:hypothetical protein
MKPQSKEAIKNQLNFILLHIQKFQVCVKED